MDIILEDTRRDLLSTSRKGKREKDGFTRYQKRLQNHLTNNKKYYNRLDMNDLFRNDIFNIEIEVRGETDNYVIKISFSGFLDELYKLIKNKDYIEFRDIIKALITAFNRNDVYIMCSCPDWFYRFGYWATIKKYNSGQPQLIPSDETNPNNNLGAGCKHVLLVLSNSSWIMKAATVINNYIKYMQRYRQSQYDSIIYPAIYRKKKPVQLSLVDDETIISDNDEEINQQGSRLRNRKPKQVDSKAISNNSSQPDNNEDETNG